MVSVAHRCSRVIQVSARCRINQLDEVVAVIERVANDESHRVTVAPAGKPGPACPRDKIRAAQEELASAFQEAGRSFYAQQQSSPPSEGEPAPSGEPAAAGQQGKPDDVVEADYEIVDEGKKS